MKLKFQKSPRLAPAERALLRSIRRTVRANVPEGSVVAVISRGDEHLLELGRRRAWHFPRMPNGVYAGHHPANSRAAIAHLEDLRARGAEFLLVPAPSFWWLDHYADFAKHLERRYRLAAFVADACAIFALSAPPGDRKFEVGLSVRPAPARKPPAQVAPVRRAARGTARRGPAAPVEGRLTVAGILDEFSTACLAPECRLVVFRPDNWKSVLDRERPDLLLVESAWRGNGGSWQYKIASNKSPMGEELVDLVTWCRKRGIPTVFWNKEDPPHFDRFVHRAPLFDCVLTSDANMIPRYRKAVGHRRVFALPFAAQPRIHHPILETNRSGNVCFAGAYYAYDHDERRADMDLLLRPALRFGLDIYDRQHGAAGAEAAAYRFPDIYQSAIKGRLEYAEMVRAYKRYKVFLNVNSVKNSPTMFSRRVFELLASGTPVVSAYSMGIVALLGGGIVRITRTEAETASHLERLLGDDDYWAEASVRGIREVMSRHTYAHRMADILKAAGLSGVSAATLPAVEAIAIATDLESVRRVARILKRQMLEPFAVTLVTRRETAVKTMEVLKQALPGLRVKVADDVSGAASGAAPEGWVWMPNPDDEYGPDFLKDALLAAVYSRARIIGKKSCFEATPRGARLEMRHRGSEFKFVDEIAAGSVVARAGALRKAQWESVATGNEFISGIRALSIDRFNYVRGGGRISERGMLERAMI